MRRISILVVLLAALSTAGVFAAAFDCTTAGPATTVADLQSAGGCFIGDYLFSNFAVGPVTGFSAVNPATIGVQVSASGLGLQFTMEGSVVAPLIAAYSLNYTVGPNPGGGTPATLNHGVLTGDVVGATGPALLSTSMTVDGQTTSIFYPTVGSGAVNFADTDVLAVHNLISPAFIVGAGSATFANTFSSVPEPATFLLMGCGLLGLGLLRKKLF